MSQVMLKFLRRSLTVIMRSVDYTWPKKTEQTIETLANYLPGDRSELRGSLVQPKDHDLRGSLVQPKIYMVLWYNQRTTIWFCTSSKKLLSSSLGRQREPTFGFNVSIVVLNRILD